MLVSYAVGGGDGDGEKALAAIDVAAVVAAVPPPVTVVIIVVVTTVVPGSSAVVFLSNIMAALKLLALSRFW